MINRKVVGNILNNWPAVSVLKAKMVGGVFHHRHEYTTALHIDTHLSICCGAGALWVSIISQFRPVIHMLTSSSLKAAKTQRKMPQGGKVKKCDLASQIPSHFRSQVWGRIWAVLARDEERLIYDTDSQWFNPCILGAACRRPHTEPQNAPNSCFIHVWMCVCTSSSWAG